MSEPPKDDGEATAAEIGGRVLEARKLAGFSQAELGDILGVSKRAVQTYEAGITIPWRHFARLAEITGRPIGWFLHGENGADEHAEMVALARMITEELERHDRAMEKRSNEIKREIRDAIEELIKTVAPAVVALSTIAAGIDPGKLPGLSG